MAVSLQWIYGMKLGLEIASQEDKEIFGMNGGCVISLFIVDLVLSW